VGTSLERKQTVPFIEEFDPNRIVKRSLKRGGELAYLYMEETVNTQPTLSMPETVVGGEVKE
jgi:hypothetical protein